MTVLGKARKTKNPATIHDYPAGTAFKAAKLLRENRARQTNKPKTIKAFKITPKDGFLPEP